MIVEAAVFCCSICGERSSEICAFCTKDACVNHRCQRCKRCSDCCECEVPLSAEEAHTEHEEIRAAEPPATSEPMPLVESVTAPQPDEPSADSRPQNPLL
jgi:hypothetical protein